ncbi:WAT1-related protein [Actinidia chinensis var. chinensis]|uniref:WAT1-related protein n=1 Tax=Actinidia chinensis var. chinensis TaxID=1590841 RepID=A0A2R6Q0X9_ACTCC|nr:WAT1-related protein [Actinidia chinensis var. chinensis]
MKSPFGFILMAIESHKPYICVVFIQSMSAGLALFTRAAIAEGNNTYVFTFYRQAFAMLALAPLAFFFERKQAAPLSWILLCKIFFVALLGITMTFNLYCLGISYTSATFASAATNTIPAITLILAVLLRVEKISITKWHGVAKVLGCVVGLGGAMVFIFIKGPPLYQGSPNKSSRLSADGNPKTEWVKGSFIMLASMTAWSLWHILQGHLVKQYPAKLRLLALQCFFSCIQTAIWAVAVERRISSWKLQWDLNLLSILYCGLIVTGMGYWLRIWVIQKKGPVFVAIFTPLTLLITAAFSAIIWKETLHWGSLCGAVLVVGGLYIILWGKHTEGQSKSIEELKSIESTKHETTHKVNDNVKV